MKDAWMHRAVALAVGAISVSALAATQCLKQSPPHTVALLELYTSEGCDSCPPADRWLGQLGREAPAADSVVPLALHVDYWDRLGWKDRFARARFTERHGILSGLSGSRVVYTPGMFLNLREFRGWGASAQVQEALRAINGRPAWADIRLELDAPASGQVAIRAEFRMRPGVPAKQPQAFVALYENGLSTDVKAGENRGVTLRHDYVVREWIGPLDPAAPFTRTVALERDWKVKNLGVAAFIQDLSTGEVLQATALAACSTG